MKTFNDFTLKSLLNLEFVTVQHVPVGSLEVKLSLILLLLFSSHRKDLDVAVMQAGFPWLSK